ncbi:MAG: hypothetical protein RhofKO_16590 [Rhodothermales bacterium]
MNPQSDNRTPHESTPPPPQVQAWLHTLPEAEREALRTTWNLAETARGDEADAESVQTALSAFWDTVDAKPAASSPRVDRPAQPRASTRRLRSLVTSALAVVLIGCSFVLGWASGTGVFSTPPHNDQTAYMVLLRGGDFEGYSPEEIAREYAAWAEHLADEGRFRGGEELAEEGRLLVREGGQTLTQPFAMSAASLAGYFIITASDYEEAAAIASRCPHLNYNGTIELRPIVGL